MILVAKNTSATLRDREGEEVFRLESSTFGAELPRIGLSRDAKYTKSRAVEIPSLPLDLSVFRSLFLLLDLALSLSFSIIDGLGN